MAGETETTVVLDGLHKYAHWKRWIKGQYDGQKAPRSGGRQLGNLPEEQVDLIGEQRCVKKQHAACRDAPEGMVPVDHQEQ
jgi:hypothetical protein